MSEHTFLSEQNLHALMFAVHLRHGLSRGEQRRFFVRMRRHLAACGYALSHEHIWCLIVPLQRQSVGQGRHVTMDWLIEQDETAVVRVHGPIPLVELLAGATSVTDREDGTLDPSTLRRLAAGASLQAVERLRRLSLGELAA